MRSRASELQSLRDGWEVRSEIDETEVLVSFVLIVIDFLGSELPDSRDAPVVARHLEGSQRWSSLGHLRRTTRAVIRLCKDLDLGQVARLDQRLSRAGLPELTRMRYSSYRYLVGVFAQRRIRSDKEYRLLRAYATVVPDPPLALDDRQRLWGLLDSYRRDAGWPAA